MILSQTWQQYMLQCSCRIIYVINYNMSINFVKMWNGNKVKRGRVTVSIVLFTGSVTSIEKPLYVN